MTDPSVPKAITLTSILSGASDGRETPGWGQRGRVHPAKFYPTKLSLRAQTPVGPWRTFCGPIRACSWASVVHRVESLGCSFKNKFLFSFKRCIKLIICSIKGKC